MIGLRMDFHGSQILGAETSRAGSTTFRAFDATSGAALGPAVIWRLVDGHWTRGTT